MSTHFFYQHRVPNWGSLFFFSNQNNCGLSGVHVPAWFEGAGKTNKKRYVAQVTYTHLAPCKHVHVHVRSWAHFVCVQQEKYPQLRVHG